ncbi:MAG: nucleotidyltransferase family protein [Chloroflexi bacterium]|nr:nucleotidyltransferase family protein [Chloroflexota bacterium]
MAIQVTVPELKIAEFCQRNHIRKLALFGSVLRNDFRADSDIDVLVEFEPDARVNYFMFVDMQDELSMLLKRQVDLHTSLSLSSYFREKVQQTAEIIYERERQHAPA